MRKFSLSKWEDKKIIFERAKGKELISIIEITKKKTDKTIVVLLTDKDQAESIYDYIYEKDTGIKIWATEEVKAHLLTMINNERQKARQESTAKESREKEILL